MISLSLQCNCLNLPPQTETMIHFLNQRTSLLPLLLLVSVSGFTSRCSSQQLGFDCPETPHNAANSTDQSSALRFLLNSLSSKASTNSFYNETFAGIYGLFLCRGDLSGENCYLCVRKAAHNMANLCPSRLNAVVYDDKCTLRYSDRDFFGTVQMSPAGFRQGEPFAGGESNTSVALIVGLRDRISEDTMYGQGEGAASSSNIKIYVTVQCTRDISVEQCRECLSEFLRYKEECCRGDRGWRVWGPNCGIRCEAFKFYELPAAPQHDFLLPPYPPGKNRAANRQRIVAIAIPSVVTMALILGLLRYAFFRRDKRREDDRNAELPLRNLKSSDEDHDGEMHYFTLRALQAATSNFSDANRLGEGGFGPVYKGKLMSGEEIAVKRLSVKSSQGHEEFKNEATVIWKLQHKNLVRLLGCCLEGEEKLLVYEYMPNSSLDALLFDPLKSKQLNWAKRENIINGIARGILYLHEDSRLKIVHRDLKASNVLLDDEMNPKISDFGMARIFGGKQINANTNRIVGTFGYMAPEYAMEGVFSVKSDVYSFGVLMLEVISGRRSIGCFSNMNDEANSLLSYAWELWKQGRGQEMIEKSLGGYWPSSEAMKWIHIALLCVQEDPNLRPPMSVVVVMLGSQSIALPRPSKPPLFSGGQIFTSDQFSNTETGHGLVSLSAV